VEAHKRNEKEGAMDVLTLWFASEWVVSLQRWGLQEYEQMCGYI
jgi:hypothetical protein